MGKKIENMNRAALLQLRAQTLERVKIIDELIKQRELEGDPETTLKKTWYVYALALEDDCYYVGISTNVVLRQKRHYQGKGAWFTTEHKPIKIIHHEKLGVMTEAEATVFEDGLAIKYIRKYGIDKVRGGRYIQRRIPTRAQRDFHVVGSI